MAWEIRQGDALERLREMPDESVQCCVTSPPYWGLRDYGVEGQLGLEATPEEYVEKLVGIFAEVDRVLRSDGTLWLNLGDSYAGRADASRGVTYRRDREVAMAPRTSSLSGGRKKNKDLVGIPWMVAFTLRAEGWYLRRDIIWSKPNPMPESVTDRPTSAHEYLFLLSKSPRYFYDAEAIRESAVSTKPSGNHYQRPEQISKGGQQSPHPWTDVGGGRNRRSVWEVSTRPYPEAHFATFPPDLVEPCILAGAPEKACGDCGAPWITGEGERTLDLSRPQARRAQELADEAGLTAAHIAAIRSCGVSDAGKAQVTQAGFGNNEDEVQALADEAKEALGGYYREFLLARPSRGDDAPSCECSAEPVPSVVLDPFAGAATTGLVATRHNRNFIGIELSPEYVELGRRRICDDAPLLNTPAEAAA